MNTTIRTVLPLLVLFGATAACAPAPGTNRPVRERTLTLPGGEMTIGYRGDEAIVRRVVGAAPDAVESALSEAYRQVGFGTDPKASGRGRIATPFLRVKGDLYDGEPNSRYLDCGMTTPGRPAVDAQSDLRFRLLGQVAAADTGGTRLDVWIEGEARPAATTEAAIPCWGTGVLENRVIGRVILTLRAGAGGRD
ncbi:MAG: hypothetical protein KY466_03265 [Gemmatimonadetes bacterium]|nr:hypothetical protein [Gemmatimonadota bacterium]